LNPGRFSCFNFILCLFGESCLLVSWCAGGRCGMACSNEDRGRSRRLGAEDRVWSHRSDNRWPGIERSGGAVCDLHRARRDEERGFLG
jgi:hypothetical protein